MECWMCDDPRFRSRCAHHGVIVQPGVPLEDPSPRVRPASRYGLN